MRHKVSNLLNEIAHQAEHDGWLIRGVRDALLEEPNESVGPNADALGSTDAEYTKNRAAWDAGYKLGEKYREALSS